ncbi:MAG: hypothetical protein IT236_11655, partial [Bacteroidia bacterium]|nr:hypothetical protein [Bacteroidia bacterium]
MFDHQQWLQSRNEMIRRFETEEEEENYWFAESEETKKARAEKEKTTAPTPKGSEALKELTPADKTAIKAPEKSVAPAKKKKPASKKTKPAQKADAQDQKSKKTAEAKKPEAKAPAKDKVAGEKQLLNSRQQLLELYYAYKKTEGHWQNIPATDEFGVSDPERNRAKKEEEARLQTLNRALKAQNFSGIGELEAYIGNYEKKFEQQTLALAEEAFNRSNKQLLEEEQHLTNDTYVALLFRQLAESGAKEHYAVAAGKSAEASGIRRDLGGYAHGDLERKGQLQEKASREKQEGTAAVKTLISPLVQDKQFDHEALAGAKNKEDLKRILIKHIQSKRKCIDYYREDLRENPEHI